MNLNKEEILFFISSVIFLILSIFTEYVNDLIIVILVAFAMWLSASLSAKVGPTIIIVVQKIFGILLGALAIEFVVAGVIESFKLQGL